MKKILFFVIAALLFTACSPKEPRGFKSGASMAINNALLEQKELFTPQDNSIRNINFVYSMFLSPDGEYLVQNELVIRTFLLAHNCTKIIIIGTEPLLSAYKAYFEQNGVIAPIELAPVDNANFTNSVQVMFFNNKNTKPTK